MANDWIDVPSATAPAAPKVGGDTPAGGGDWVDVAPAKSTSVGGLAASATRGVAPYAAGAGIGAGIGALAGGVGAIPGAAVGAGAVALADTAIGIWNPIAERLGLPRAGTAQEATDKLLDFVGEKRPETGIERETEALTGGAAGALSGAGAARQAAQSLTGTAGGVAKQLAARPVGQAVSGASGAVASQTAAELGAGQTTQQIAGLIGSAAPYGATRLATGSASKINASDNAKRAIGAGFALPPAEASEGHIGEVNLPNMAAGEAGKIKLGQLAAAKNQPLVNLYAQKELGVDPGTPLMPEQFKAVRSREGQVYNEVTQAVPEVDLARDPTFVAEAKKVGSPSAETERLFPSTTEPPGVKALREELVAHARGDTKAVMNYIADLRFRATKNFQTPGNAMAHREGAAQREAAGVLEDAMERSVQNAPNYYQEKLDQAIAKRAEATADLNYAHPSTVTAVGGEIEGVRNRVAQANAEVNRWTAALKNAENKNAENQTLVDRFRDARRNMAKSYDVEAVTNPSTGDVSATGLGRLLKQGKPLTGNLKLIADSANSFQRAFQNPAAFGGVEPLSVFDAAAAGGMALSGHPLAAASVIARPWLRGRVLSPGYQQRMIAPPGEPSPLPMLLSPGFSPNPYDALGIKPP